MQACIHLQDVTLFIPEPPAHSSQRLVLSITMCEDPSPGRHHSTVCATKSARGGEEKAQRREESGGSGVGSGERRQWDKRRQEAEEGERERWVPIPMGHLKTWVRNDIPTSTGGGRRLEKAGLRRKC